MHPDLENKLYQKYPNFFTQKDWSWKDSCMPLGIECGDGWYSIIDTLAAKLEPMNVEATQVKEKFGSLTVYVSRRDDAISAALKEAAQQSLKTCEICGQPGELNKGPWLKVRCKEHE